MGASRNNPRSTQYTGPMPEELCLAQIEVRLKATEEWIKANPDSLDKPPDDQIEVHLLLSVGRAEPSALFPGEPHRWPRTTEGTAIGPLLIMTENGAQPAVMTLPNFRKLTPINGRTEPPGKDGASGLLAPGSDAPPWKQ